MNLHPVLTGEPIYLDYNATTPDRPGRGRRDAALPGRPVR
jgi:hypothetical protein